MLCKMPAHMTELAKMILSEESKENPSSVTGCVFNFEGADDQDNIDVDRFELVGVTFYVKDKTLHVVGVSSEPVEMISVPFREAKRVKGGVNEPPTTPRPPPPKGQGDRERHGGHQSSGPE